LFKIQRGARITDEIIRFGVGFVKIKNGKREAKLFFPWTYN